MAKITLAGCAILKQDKILLLSRKKRGWYKMPGGKYEETDKDTENTAKRECEEELGIKVEILRELGGNSFEEDGDDMEYVWYLGRITEGTPDVQEKMFNHCTYSRSADLVITHFLQTCRTLLVD